MVALLFAIPEFYTPGIAPEKQFPKPLDADVLLLSVVLIQAWSKRVLTLTSGGSSA